MGDSKNWDGYTFGICEGWVHTSEPQFLFTPPLCPHVLFPLKSSTENPKKTVCAQSVGSRREGEG